MIAVVPWKTIFGSTISSHRSNMCDQSPTHAVAPDMLLGIF